MQPAGGIACFESARSVVRDYAEGECLGAVIQTKVEGELRWR